MRLDVIFADAAARAAALHFMNVDADFSRQPANVRRSGNRFTVFSSRNLAQLLRHGKSLGRRGRRLIRRKYLFFGLSLGLDCRLQ